MIYCGIDPGMSGGIGWIGEEIGNVNAIPFKDMTDTDIFETLSTALRADDSFTYIESVHSMPAQGVSSTFKFGVNFGILRGILAALQAKRDFVTPQKWQKELGCLTHGDKNISKAKAQRLFPKLKITHAIADALLIAEYCRRIRSK